MAIRRPRSTASAQTRTESEIREILTNALVIKGLEQLFQEAVEARRQELSAERKRMRQQMESQESGQPAE
jgi:plasmid stability protein